MKRTLLAGLTLVLFVGGLSLATAQEVGNAIDMDSTPIIRGQAGCTHGVRPCDPSCANYKGRATRSQGQVGANGALVDETGTPLMNGADGANGNYGNSGAGSGRFAERDMYSYMQSGAGNFVPDMIGDSTFAGAGYGFGFSGGGGSINIGGYSSSLSASQPPLPAFNLSRLNIAENFNAEIQNRVFFDYRHFDNAGTFFDSAAGTTSLDIERFTLGVERKLGNCSSLEFRLPVTYGFGSEQHFNSGNVNFGEDAEFGNLSLVYKRIFLRKRCYTLMGGVGLNMPTAPDYDFTFIHVDNTNTSFTGKVEIGNDVWRLIPYLGLQFRPNRCLFGHFVAQVDTPLSQSKVMADYEGTRAYGEFYDQTLLRLNASLGRWLYKNERARFMNAIGGMVELHYTAALDSACNRYVRAGGGLNSMDVYAGSLERHAQVLNMVGGVPIQLGKTTVLNAVSVPLTNQQYFDWEYTFSISRRF